MKLVLIADLVLAILLVVCVFRGYKKGFVKSVFGCLSLVLAIILSYFFGSYAADYIRKTSFYESTRDGIYDIIADKVENMKDEGIRDIEESKQSFENSAVAENLRRLGLDTASLFDRYEMSVKESADNAMGGLAEEVSEKIAHCLANALGVLAVFLVSLALLKLSVVVLDKIFTLPVLNAVNRLAGLAAGIVLGLLVCFVLCTVTEILIPCIPENPVIYAGMERDTYLYGFFLNLNPIILLLFGS